MEAISVINLFLKAGSKEHLGLLKPELRQEIATIDLVDRRKPHFNGL